MTRRDWLGRTAGRYALGMSEYWGYGAFDSAQRTPASRAAIAVWIAAGVELALFGCCGVLFALIATVLPASDFAEAAAAAQASPSQVRVMLWVGVVLVSVVMVVPGFVLLGLGFPVRAGKRAAMIAAAVMLLVQAALLAGFTLLQVVASAAMGELLAGLLQTVVRGPAVAVLVWAVVEVLRAWRSAGGGGSGAVPMREDAWNSPHAGESW